MVEPRVRRAILPSSRAHRLAAAEALGQRPHDMCSANHNRCVWSSRRRPTTTGHMHDKARARTSKSRIDTKGMTRDPVIGSVTPSSGPSAAGLDGKGDRRLAVAWRGPTRLGPFVLEGSSASLLASQSPEGVQSTAMPSHVLLLLTRIDLIAW